MSLARSSFLYTLGTFLSRISGLIRDSVMSGVFGAGSSVEAFFVANRIPNLFRDMLAEGALGSSFTKVYTTISVDDEARAHRLLCDAFRFGFYFLLSISALGVLTAPIFVQLLTILSSESNRPSAFYRETVVLTRILFPFLGFAILAALAGGVLQQRGKFFLAAVSSSGLNVGYIIGSLLFGQIIVMYAPASLDSDYVDRRILGLALGVVLGGVFHFLAQFRWIWKELIAIKGWTVSPRLISKDLYRVFLLMMPAAVASSAGSINLLVNTNFATALDTGAVTWLNYAFRLLQLPVGIFAVAVGSVTLPSLTRAVAIAGNRVDERVSRELEVSCEFINWLMVGCLAFLLFSCLPTVQLLFQHGKFDEASAKATADALFAYSFGVVGYGLIKVLTSFYYAIEKTSYAMRVSLAMVAVNALSNYLLAKQFGHIGLAATSSITLSGNALFLALGLRKNGFTFHFRECMRAYGWLAAAFVVSMILQVFLVSASRHFPGYGAMPLKLRALNDVLFAGVTVVAVFTLAAMIRLRVGPKAALQKLRAIKRGRRG